MEDLELDLQTPEINVELGQNLIEIELPGGARGLKGDDGEPGPEGPQGPQGERGSSGVWVGPNDPPDDSYNVWIDSDGEESTIPTKISQLENDKGFITNEVDDLVNYPTNAEFGTALEEKADANDLDTTNQNLGITQGNIDNVKSAIDYKNPNLMGNVVVEGIESKNIFNESFTVGNLSNDASTLTKRLSARDTGYIEAGTYTWSTNMTDEFNYGLAVSSSQYPSSQYDYDSGWSTDGEKTFTTTGGYFGVNFKRADGTEIFIDDINQFNFQLEKGDTSTEYKPKISFDYQELFNDTAGADWQTMMKNKLDYCIENIKTTKTNISVFINGGWLSNKFGHGMFSKIGTTYQLTWFGQNCSYYCIKLNNNYQYYQMNPVKEVEHTLVENTSGQSLPIPLISSTGTGLKNFYNTSGFYSYIKQGTTSASGRSEIALGTVIAEGTVGNKDSTIRMFCRGTGSNYIANTQKHDSTFWNYLPPKNGTFAVYENGTTNGWTWIKIGPIAICWKYLTASIPANGFTQWGGVYSRDSVFAAQTYPFTFTSDPFVGITPYRNSVADANPNFWIYTGLTPPSNSKTTSPDFGIARGSNWTNAGTAKAIIYAIGMV